MRGKEKSEQESEVKPRIAFEAIEGAELTADEMTAVAQLVAAIIHEDIKARRKSESQKQENQK